ncbi:glycosyltransferase [Enterococcus camelliae]|uniref:Glycosyltransferase n=1 Tax=Enterococcus camelliae TaxID=453959 RepID=A0ABW5TIP4_9ENTE
MNSLPFIESITNKDVLFVSTKNIDYIRNTQEIELLSSTAKSIKIIASKKKNYFARLCYVYWHFSLALIKKNFDCLFIGFAPQLLFPFIYFFPKNKLIIMDFFISFYDTLVDDRKKFKDGKFISNVLKKIDALIIHKADIVIADTNAHKKYFSLTFHFPEEKIEVLYIVADTSIYKAKPRPKNKRFEVIYFGSILPVQGIEIILDAMKLLSKDSSIHFTIIGPISKKLQINQDNFPQTSFIPWLSQVELANLINQSDLALAGHFSSTVGKAKRTIAGKTYIYKAMNKPVILGNSPANHELFKPDSSNIYVDLGNSTELARAIVEQAKLFYRV